MNKRVLRYLSYAIFVGGIGLILDSSFRITGGVIGVSIGGFNLGFILGLALLIGGVIGIYSSATLEVRLRDVSKNRYNPNPSRDYMMSDPEMMITKEGEITLGEIKEQKKRLGPEVFGLVREVYGDQVKKQCTSHDEKTARVARAFYRELYDSEFKSESEVERKVKTLSSKEEDEIYQTFKPGWSGEPNSAQSRILRKYDMIFEKKSGHGAIYSGAYHDIHVPVSSTTSDINAGRNIGKDVIKMVKRAYERDNAN